MNPYAVTDQRPLAPDAMEALAAKQAAGGRDIIDYIKSLERRIERLEAQLKTH